MQKLKLRLFSILLLISNCVFAGNFYWVGGSGSWQDAQHWANISGGTAGAGIPTSTDNVYFDNYSSKNNAILNITINQNITVRNIYFNNPTEIYLSSNVAVTLNISSIYSMSSPVFTNGNIDFLINTGKNSHLAFAPNSNIKGKIIIANNTKIKLDEALNLPAATLEIDKGSLNLNSFDLICKSLIIKDKNVNKIKAPNSNILILDQLSLPSAVENRSDFNNAKVFLPNDSVLDLSHFQNPQVFLKGHHDKSTTVTVNNDTVSCGNNCDGALKATITSTCVQTDSINWLPGNPNGDGTDSIFNLCPGTYQIVVYDSCIGNFVTASGVVSGHSQIVVISQTITPPTCHDSCNGSINIFATGSISNLTYNWSTGFTEQSATGSTISNLCVGTDSVDITDSTGCDTNITFNVPQPSAVSPNATGNTVSCYNNCDGIAISNPSGGTPPYISYQWNDPLTQTTQSATNLCPGNYIVIVTDTNGCTGVDTATINAPLPFNIDTNQTNVSCNGACDAQIAVNILGGGTPPYFHHWNTGATSSSLSNLCPGTYVDTVKDVNGCDTVITFNVTEPPVLLSNTTAYNIDCFGNCDGSAVVAASGGTLPYSYNWNPGNLSTDSISNLCAGTYVVVITDNDGCTKNDTAIISQPPPLNGNPSFTNPTCNGVCNGSAAVNPSGGTTPYQYSWSPGGQTSQSINSLCQGTYTVQITDSNGCQVSDTINITQPSAINIQLSSTDMSCNNVCDGTATIDTITGGTSPYTIIWTPGNIPDSNLTALCAGTYTVTVTDNNGCQQSDSVTINNPAPITVNTTSTDVTCNGACDGTATVTNVTGGSGTYVSYQWNTTPVQNGLTASNLCPATYTVTVTDNNNCTGQATVNINEPPALTVNTNSTNVTCNGACDGTASVSVSGGTPTYSYSWSPGGQTTAAVNNLCAGTYIVTISDQTNCSQNDTITITEPDTLKPNVQVTDMSCHNICDGAATCYPTGGTPPYSYSWMPGGQTTQGISGQCAGSYAVTITDANGCTATQIVNIQNPPSLSATTNAIAASCGTICNGIGAVTPTGGTPGYTYQWNDPLSQTTQTADSLCAGTYQVTITDTNGCSLTTSVIINNLIIINVSTDTINFGCNGTCDGSATAVASGGAAPYTYSWSDGQTTQTADSLCPGSYVVTATDANGCASTDTVTIPVSPSVLVANGSFTPPSCNGQCNGTATANPTGGTPPYSYSWFPGGQTSQSINNLCAGTYAVSVTDSDNCTQTDTLHINQPDSIKANYVITNIDCNGNCNGIIALNITGGTPPYVINWSNGATNDTVSGLCAGTYTVNIIDNNGCTFIAFYTITQPPAIAANTTATDALCNGDCNGTATALAGGGTAPYAYFWSPGGNTAQNIDSLCPGTYSVTVTDSNGCITNANVTVSQPAPLQVNTSGTNIDCGGICNGTAIANPSGGTAPYQYSWNPGGQISQSINALCQGTYNVIVTDTNGCIANGSYTVTEPDTFEVTLSSTDALCNGACNGTATATPTGGTGPYQYNWMPGGETTQTINNLCQGNYTVTVTDVNGCYFTGTVTVNQSAGISPNEAVTDANCGACDGVISLSPTGGSPPYQYNWTPGGQTTPTISSLCLGTYQVLITDANGCTDNFSFNVNNTNGPTGATITENDATCNGACDGNANVIPIGGTSPYGYSWNPGGQTTPTVNNLCAGTYNVTITDNNGCAFIANVNIGEADSLSLTFNTVDATCNGLCDGQASVSVSGGTPPYSYQWIGNGSITSSASGLCAGTYQVNVTDANGCSKTGSITINQPTALSSNINSTPSNCFNSCDGSAEVFASGGTPGYTYLWNDGAINQTDTGLCAGNYSVQITDGNGCSIFDTVTVTAPPQITATFNTTDATCGACDGTAAISTSGGTPPYSILWSNGVNGNSVVALCAGTYTATVTDANGCQKIFTVGISNTNGPTVNTNSTNATCSGSCDGSASATASGVNGPFTYLWTPGGQTSPNVSGLCAGTYTVTVTNSVGCQTIKVIQINEDNLIQANINTTPTSCSGTCDGTALANVSGGTPPYTISWPNSQTGPFSNGYCSGNYSVTITDAKGCSIVKNFTINSGGNIILNTNETNTTCNNTCDGTASVSVSGGTPPYSYQWNNGQTTQNINNLCPGNYSVTVTDASGCTANSSVNIISGAGAITANINTTNASCGQCDGSAFAIPAGGNGAPYTFDWNPINETNDTANNLCPGGYNLVITDNNGCSQNFNVVINQNGGPNTTINSSGASCFDSCNGQAWVNIISGNPPFTYQWNDPNLQTNDTAIGLCFGTYNVVIQDSSGCISVDSVTIQQPPQIQANISETNPSCNGTCDGSVTANPTGGSGSYTYLWNPGGQTNQTVNNLCPGVYTVTITDATGCQQTDSVSLISPPVLTVNITGIDAPCNASCNGYATANPSGGTPPYSYLWNNGQTSQTAINLCAGNYNVTVTDANGCTQTANVTINEPTALSTSTTTVNPTCNGVCNGSATTTPTGGTPPYSYQWNDGQTTQTANNLCAGIYLVIVSDANGCTAYDTVTLTSPTVINANVAVNNASCGLCDGSATTNPTGGSGTYLYQWSNGQTSQTAVGLCAGIYQLIITDAITNCLDTFQIVVNNVNGPTLTISTQDESCSGYCDGFATVFANGANPFIYNWSNGANTQTDNNLCAGTYTVTVTDSLGCVSIDSATINSFTLNATINNLSNPICNNDCNGSATVIPTNGTPAYTYLWNPGGQTTPTVNNLCPGNYTVTVTDQTGCSTQVTAIMTNPSVLLVNAIVISNTTCGNNCNGSATVNAIGGTAPYNYQWSDGQTTQNATNLCAGTYFVNVTDADGCTAADTITIAGPPPILANDSAVFPTCGICNGSISLNPSGGTGPYSYNWNTGDVTQVISNLCAGAYMVTITDNIGCTANFTIPLSDINGPTISTNATDVLCNGSCNGSVIVNVSGGTAPFTYLWTPGNATTPTDSNLCAGNYTVTVTDSNGCISVANDTVSAPQPLVLQATSTAATCDSSGCDGTATVNITGGTPPYSYQWNDPNNQTTATATGLCGGIYNVTVTDANNCSQTTSVSVTAPGNFLLDSVSITPATCNGVCNGGATVHVSGGTAPFTYTWSNGDTTQSVTGLCVGAITVTVTDSSNCTVQATVNIPSTDSVIVNAGLDTAYCFGNGPVTLSGSVGSNVIGYAWINISTGDTLDTSLITTVNPPVGINCYVLQATNGSCTNHDTVCVTVYALPNVDAGNNVNIIINGTTVLTATGGGAGATYTWSPTKGLKNPNSASTDCSPDSTTTYYVTAIDANGCSSTDSVVVTVLPAIKFPNGITPNGDGKNDKWVIDFIDQYPNNVVEIYNRWGELLFKEKSYQNDWDGRYKGKLLPVGTYYYIINLHEEGTKVYTGPLTVVW